MKRVIFGILVVVVISGLFYYLFTRNKKEEDASIKIAGNIEATEVNLGFKISGRIVNLFVQEGDWVVKGKVLAKLDDEDLLQRVELAKATLKSNQARMAQGLA